MHYGYLAFMGLLCATLTLWGVVALRDDSPPEQDGEETGAEDEKAAEEDEPKDSADSPDMASPTE
jgi:hypothetical protein